MDRATIELHLASAEEHVALGADTVERQREIIVNLERDDHGAVEAQRLLVYFEESWPCTSRTGIGSGKSLPKFQTEAVPAAAELRPGGAFGDLRTSAVSL